ncbi:hypothetical protein VSH64_24845 [Amycolatopsis rhabdoformis]|uniref:Uncharacterized protein n=1 Tax=Amycolatopsis rhabdoformis TaxID=1448059 RepID=A0ABZ1HWW8_9PSEU|nr:hypothetical protein [Amycolatopsis rhabdoformis]WSE26106.1 hypothetical protein VSH64_24845 [Amycolatopsis rhabdoformis]
MDFEALTCNGCGGYLPETTDPENEARYLTEPPHRCHRCTSIAAKQENYQKAKHPNAYVAWPTFLKEA